MDSNTEIKNEEHGPLCDLKRKVKELESELFEEKQRFELLKTELDKYKIEFLNIEEIKSDLEMQLKSFQEKQEKDKEMIKSLTGMIDSYYKKFSEFMMKHGDENTSLRERNDAVVVKKEIEDNIDDEMLNVRKNLLPVGADVDEDNIVTGKWSKKTVIKEMWMRENSSTYGWMPWETGKSFNEKANQNLGKKKPKVPDTRHSLIVSDIESPILRKRSSSHCPSRVYTGRPADDEQRLHAIRRAEEIQRKLKSKNPSFIRSLVRSHVSGSFWMVLNPEFCKKHLGISSYNVILEDENGSEFEVKYLGHVCALSGGWAGFAKNRKLELYDAVLFELCEPNRFKVHIIKANEEPLQGSQNKPAITERMEGQDANLLDVRPCSKKMNKRNKHEAKNAENDDFFSF